MQTVRTPPEIAKPPTRVPSLVMQPAQQRGFWDTVRKHPLIIGFLLVAGAAAGVAAGYSRTPVFTASVPMVITQVNTNAPGGLSGYAAAAPQLADAYSRMAMSRAIYVAVGRKLHLTPDQVSGRISAALVPGSPVFYLHGQGMNGPAAIRLANTASTQLVLFVRKTNSPSPTAGQLLAEYRAAQQRQQAARIAQAKAQAKFDAIKSRRNETALLAARAAGQIARVRASSLETAYRNLTATNIASTNLRVATPATAASSSRRASIEKLGVLGAVAGLVLGLALAWLIGSHRWRRNKA